MADKLIFNPLTPPFDKVRDDLADLTTKTHSSLSSLTSPADDHTQYVLLAGRAGGQTLIGDTASGGNLTLQSTYHATKGKILFGTSAYDEVNNRLGIGNNTPSVACEIGSNTSGQSIKISATLTEKAPSLQTPNWTLGTGWQYLTSPDRLDKNAAGTGEVTVSSSMGIVIGVTYKVIIIVDSISGAGATYRVGGVQGGTITNGVAGTYTDYITAASTEDFKIFSVNTNLRITISQISVSAVTNGTGDLLVEGKAFISNLYSLAGTRVSSPAGITSILECTGDFAGNFYFLSQRSTVGNIGNFRFQGKDDANNLVQYALFGGGSIDRSSSSLKGMLFFYTMNSGTLAERMRIDNLGNLGLGITSPTAVLHLKAGTATASTAPLKFTSGVVNTTAEAGALEFVTDDLTFVITTGAARKGIVLDDGARLTSGKIPVATTNGRLVDGQTPLAGTKVYYVADSSGGTVNRKLTFTNGILTAET